MKEARDRLAKTEADLQKAREQWARLETEAAERTARAKAQEKAREAEALIQAAEEIRRMFYAPSTQAAESAKAGANRGEASSSAAGTYSSGLREKCAHSYFWARIENPKACGRCGQDWFRYAFQCPGCDVVACAPCREELRRR